MRELKQRFVNQGVEGLRQQRRLQFLEEKVGHIILYIFVEVFHNFSNKKSL